MVNHSQKKISEPAGNPISISRNRALILLAIIVILAAVLRLAKPGTSPPGAHQDEIANAWNAWCLLKTGNDQTGDPWPFFYSRCMGENRTALYYYFLMPFQWFGGFNIVTTRLPNMVGGVLSVLLIYYVGTRLFDRRVGLLAALLLTLNPWHLQSTRWGHESGICPLVVLLSVALILRARLPLINHPDTEKPRPIWALLAGLACGISCYGYPAIRLFLPAFLLIAILNRAGAWVRALKTKTAIPVILFFVGFAVTFGPLAYKHITEPEKISRRSENLWCWTAEDTTPVKMIKVALRYAVHFDPDFLFVRGDSIPSQNPYRAGEFHWYMAVLMPLGLIAGIRRWRSNPTARLMVLFLLCYPLGDILNSAWGAHSMRSSPGLPGLVLLGAFGGAAMFDFLRRKRQHILAGATVLVLVGAGVFLNIQHIYQFFRDYDQNPKVRYLFMTDMLEAFETIKPQYDQYAAIFCTVSDSNMPNLPFLLAMNYDPAKWVSEPPSFTPNRYSFDIKQPGPWDLYTRIGKTWFLYDDSCKTEIEKLRNNTMPDRVAFILRPKEAEQMGLRNPVKQLMRSGNKVTLGIYETTL